MKRQPGRRNPGIGSVVTGMVVALFLTLGAAATWVSAEKFTEAELFLELNHTDQDLGIHASIDGGPWVQLEIEDPKGGTMLKITAQGRLARQNLTQLFLESAEPPLDEQPAATFFRRFPEGWYEIEGKTAGGKEFKARVRLSHVLAAPPDNIMVGPNPAAEDCDTVPLPMVPVGMPVLIVWDQVTDSHPDIGTPDQKVEIARYQFFVERGAVKLAVDLPPDVTQFQVPASIVAEAGTYKFEIIARTKIGDKPGNNTAIESCFSAVIAP